MSSTSTLAISVTPSVAPAPAAFTVKSSGADHFVRAPDSSPSCAATPRLRERQEHVAFPLVVYCVVCKHPSRPQPRIYILKRGLEHCY